MSNSPPARAPQESGATGALIAGVASLATALVFLTWHGASTAARSHPLDFAVFLVLTAALMLLAVDIYGKGSISVSGVTLLATGFTFGVGAGILAGIFAAGVHAIRRRSRPHKALFNAATFAVAAGAGAAVYHALPHSRSHSALLDLGPAIAGGATFWAVNIGLLTLVMSLSQGRAFRPVWNEHFRWLTLHYLAFGPLAIACTIAYQKVGLVGLLAFALPPALLIVSVQQYIEKTRASVAEIERANEELRRSNTDLRELFEFATGLAAQTHDTRQLASYARGTLQRLTGARVQVTVGDDSPDGATPLTAAGRVVGGLRIDGGDAERWARLREAIVPQLATALESTMLAEEVRKTHLETIAALSRSMEAKDNYTGGHTERVSDIAIGLAKRLGYTGADLDAIEIGALMHDIGKIGIPESILHKPGPLDNDEWIVMKRHPVISELILKEIDLSPIVTEIARSSHERMDGQGYPDGLKGDEIPLPARIVLVADAFDALTTDRPYRRARRPKAALDEIVAHSGDQFCPKVVAALKEMYVEEPAVLGEVQLTVVAS
jgi:HD-GYP domain-containing protein (c-di-GMP phosphodiesterase class II)